MLFVCFCALVYPGLSRNLFELRSPEHCAPNNEYRGTDRRSKTNLAHHLDEPRVRIDEHLGTSLINVRHCVNVEPSDSAGRPRDRHGDPSKSPQPSDFSP